MKKGGKKINLTLVFSARALYSAIAILIVLIAGVGVLAVVVSWIWIEKKALRKGHLLLFLAFFDPG